MLYILLVCHEQLYIWEATRTRQRAIQPAAPSHSRTVGPTNQSHEPLSSIRILSHVHCSITAQADRSGTEPTASSFTEYASNHLLPQTPPLDPPPPLPRSQHTGHLSSRMSLLIDSLIIVLIPHGYVNTRTFFRRVVQHITQVEVDNFRLLDFIGTIYIRQYVASASL